MKTIDIDFSISGTKITILFNAMAGTPKIRHRVSSYVILE